MLVSVSKPSFNPNTIDENWDSLIADDESGVFLNRGLQGQYPPGSTFKIVTALAYLRQNQTVDGFSFDCVSEVTNGGYTIHCAGNEVHGQEDFYSAFANSCNSAFATIGLSLDKGSFQSLADTLYLNTRLDLELPTSRSSFSVDSSTADALMMQTAIGQGNTLVTPLEMALIASAVANDGVMMKPYFVDRVEAYDGTEVSQNSPEKLAEVMSSSEADKLTELMTGVVENGTARSLNDLGYNIAGKTGSAEHGDMTEDTHSWFVGFSNAEDPDLVVAVIAERRRQRQLGGGSDRTSGISGILRRSVTVSAGISGCARTENGVYFDSGGRKMIEAVSCGGVVIYRGKILTLYKNYKKQIYMLGSPEGYRRGRGNLQGDSHPGGIRGGRRTCICSEIYRKKPVQLPDPRRQRP